MTYIAQQAKNSL